MTLFMIAAALISSGVGPYNTVLEGNDVFEVFPENHIVLIGCEIAYNAESPGMDDFSERTQGWSGCTDGRNEPHFIFKSEVSSADADGAMQEAGAVAYNNFPVAEAIEKIQSGEESWDDYLDGSVVMAAIRWIDSEGEIREVAFERFFTQLDVGRNGEEIEKEFTPHFVYHGSSMLNGETIFGCLVCQQDCSGGLVCNNSGACCRPVPMLKPDWDLIPAVGTDVTLVMYIMPER